MTKETALCLAVLMFAIGCAPYVTTQMDNKITMPAVAERKISIQTDPKDTELVLIVKPLEEKLASKGYTLVAAPDQAAYTIRLHLIHFALKGSHPRTYGTAMGAGLTAGNLVGGSTGAVFGYGVGSLLSGPASVPFVGKVKVSIGSRSSEEQQTTIYAAAEAYKGKEPAAREAVAHALANKIAAMMP